MRGSRSVGDAVRRGKRDREFCVDESVRRVSIFERGETDAPAVDALDRMSRAASMLFSAMYVRLDRARAFGVDCTHGRNRVSHVVKLRNETRFRPRTIQLGPELL